MKRPNKNGIIFIILFGLITFFSVKTVFNWWLVYSDEMHNFDIFVLKWGLWLMLILIPLSLTIGYIKVVYGMISNDDDDFYSIWCTSSNDMGHIWLNLK